MFITVSILLLKCISVLRFVYIYSAALNFKLVNLFDANFKSGGETCNLTCTNPTIYSGSVESWEPIAFRAVGSGTHEFWKEIAKIYTFFGGKRAENWSLEL